jgi:hypothetical protein
MEGSVRGGQLLQPFLSPGKPLRAVRQRASQRDGNLSAGRRCPSILSMWESLTFGWVNKLMALGARRQLEHADLFTLEESLEPRMCCQLMWTAWREERRNKGEHASLLQASIRTYGRQFFALGIIKVSP